MKRFLFLIALFFLFSSLTFSQENTQTKSVSEEGKLTGVVSSKYKKKGCGYLVQVKIDGKKLYFMPKTPLDKEFEKNGLSITFNYRRLRLPSPPNCEFCYMVDLKNIEKK